VAITVRGTLLAARLLAEIEGLELYAPARFLDAVPQTRATERHRPTEAERRRMTAYSEPVATLIARLFAGSRGLILVMAAGVAVRLIAPMLKDKRTDPAVVVVDDAGRFAISLLSGHLGGANRLAERVAGLVGACPVVTTASAGAGLPAADLLGRELGWRAEHDLDSGLRETWASMTGPA